MIKALIFDFDGLILDTETPQYHAWAAAFQAHGCTLTLDKWGEAIGTAEHFDPHEHLETLAGRELDRETVRGLWHPLFAEVHRIPRPLPGVAETILAAKSLGLSLAVASSSTHPWVEGHLRRLELHHHFASFSCREDVERTKPDPALYLAAMRALGVGADEAIAIEDSAQGVRAAKAAGLFAIAVPNPVTRQMDFSHADLVLGSLEELELGELVAVAEFPPGVRTLRV